MTNADIIFTNYSEDDIFSEELSNYIDENFGKIATESQKEELINSLLFILDKHSRKLQADNLTPPNIASPNFPCSSPIINLYLIPQPIFRPNMQPSPNYAPTSPYYIPVMQQPPLLTNSPYNYPTLQNPIPYPPNKKREDTKSKKEKHKSKKDKKSKKKDKSSKEKHTKKKGDQKGSQKFEYKEGHEFEGILHHLAVLTGGDISKNGTIQLTSNSICSEFHRVSYLLDSTDKTYAAKLSDWPKVQILFDFKDRLVNIDGYSIKSSSHSIGHITNWVIEISDDNQEWSIIDQQSNYTELSHPNAVKTFAVKPKGFKRYCRFRHTSKPSGNGNVEFCRIEFFGRLKNKD